MFWKIIRYDPDFLDIIKDKNKITDLSRWRLQYFIKNLVDTENPLKVWNHTTCDKNKDFHLIGLNDDGLGNKKLEIVIQMDFENKTLKFSMIEEINL